MKSYIQFITVPTADSPGTCILLHYDNQRYLFGHIAEGTMRACAEIGLSLRKVHKLFISGTTSRESTGGLLGMLLTLADAAASAQETLKQQAPKARLGLLTEASDISVYGPPNLVHSVAAARKFIFRKSTPTTIQDIQDVPSERNEQGDWLPRVFDTNTNVFALVVKPNQNGALAASSTPAQPSPDDTAKDIIRQNVINEMFNSKWRLDTLVEKMLCEVEPPAKIWVRNHVTKDLELYTGPVPGGTEPLPNPYLKVLVRNPWPAATIAKLPQTELKSETVSYIVRGSVTRGKFVVAKALKLGLKPGPLFSKLSNGESVQLEDGRTIQPEEVLGPDVQCGGFAIMDVPSDDYVEPLLAREELKTEQVMAGVGTYVWLLGSGVSQNQALQKFIRERPHVQHLITSLDHNTNALVAQSAAESAIKLAQIDQKHFPIPYYDSTTVPQPSFRRACGLLPAEVDQQKDLFSLPNVRLAERGLILQLDPKRVMQEDGLAEPLNTTDIVTSLESREVIELAKEVRQSALSGPLQQELKDWHGRVTDQDAEVITLGTGSAMPSKYRNVSATLVRVPQWGSYLLDAGENTLGQLQRVFNPEELVEVLRDLRMIWISHGHADHHLGTVSVIKAWYDVVHGKKTSYPPVSPESVEILIEAFRTDGPAATYPADKRPKYLAVMGNRFMVDYLHEISLVEDFGYDYVLPIVPTPASTQNAYGPNVVCNQLRVLLTKPDLWTSDPLPRGPRLFLLGLQSASAVNVEHCNGARALSLKFRGGFSVAYSGDCRPSSHFAQEAKGASLLIHEATFDDELKGEAMAKKHSTVQEAISVASLMEAQSLILTHFSQRYQKVPVLDHIWDKTEEVKEQIKREAEETGTKALPKDPDAEEDVDEIAEDDPILPEPTKTAAGESDVAADEMEQDELEDRATTETGATKDTRVKVVFAFDYMRIRIGDIPILQAYRPALTKLFERETEESNRKRGVSDAANGGDLKRQGSVKKAKNKK